jgi:peroxiredoxin
MPRTPLQVGDPAAWFYAKSASNPRFCFDSVAGRYVALTFFRSAADPYSQSLFAAFSSAPPVFDDDHACWFGVSSDADDESRLQDSSVGFRFLFDPSQSIAQAYGVSFDSSSPGLPSGTTFLLDERLRVLGVFPGSLEPAQLVERLVQQVVSLPRFADPAPAQAQAPVLIVPRIFEPQLCQTLIQY